MKFIAHVCTLALVIASGVNAQTTRTTITDTIYDGAGGLVTGSCTYSLASGRATGAAGSQVAAEPVTVRFTSGAFSALVVPTDTMTPSGQSYTVRCSGTRGWSKSGYWTVPTSGSPITLDAVWVSVAPVPPVTFLPSQINARGKATGTYCLTVVDGVVTGLVLCTAGSGTTPATWSAMTSAWSSYTSAWSSYQ
jgi:hypothetical protein